MARLIAVLMLFIGLLSKPTLAVENASWGSVKAEFSNTPAGKLVVTSTKAGGKREVRPELAIFLDFSTPSRRLISYNFGAFYSPSTPVPSFGEKSEDFGAFYTSFYVFATSIGLLALYDDVTLKSLRFKLNGSASLSAVNGLIFTEYLNEVGRCVLQEDRTGEVRFLETVVVPKDTHKMINAWIELKADPGLLLDEAGKTLSVDYTGIFRAVGSSGVRVKANKSNSTETSTVESIIYPIDSELMLDMFFKHKQALQMRLQSLKDVSGPEWRIKEIEIQLEVLEKKYQDYLSRG